MNYNNFNAPIGLYKPTKGSLLDSATLDERLKSITATRTREEQLQREIDFREQEEKDMAKNNNNNLNQTYAQQGLWIGNSIGLITGLAYAFKIKSGFWKGFGISFLSGAVVGGLGLGVGSLVKKK